MNRPNALVPMSRRALLTGLASAGLASAGQVSPAAAQVLDGPARAAAIAEAQTAFNALRSVTARFTQTDPDGRTSRGMVSMLRPNKMRLDYAAPSALVTIADGTNVTVQDTRLRSVNRYPQRATPLYFLLKDQINLAQDVNVTRVERTGSRLMITVRDRRREADGELTVAFNTETRTLSEWAIRDRGNRITRVVLSDIRPATGFPRGHFVAPPPPVSRRKQ
ncbi:MAG: outer membrane lipoprotein carrier protein LolA [Hyphomonadaceae bacterium]|jgi:outer membrane lipoprotein-sorting protein|nr:outer membrane lipoprotein carrier protein LolA [Hyphomonadaceae bacterium]